MRRTGALAAMPEQRCDLDTSHFDKCEQPLVP
jgi:hypothetical protein